MATVSLLKERRKRPRAQTARKSKISGGKDNEKMEVVEDSMGEGSEMANTRSETELFDNASDEEVDPAQKMLPDSPVASAAGDVATPTPARGEDEATRKARRKERSAAKRQEKKAKKALTAGVEGINLSEKVASRPKAQARKSRTPKDATPVSGESRRGSGVNPLESPKRAEVKQISGFAREMGNGMWVVASQCHPKDHVPETEDIARAWHTMKQRTSEASSLPYPQSIASYGSNFCLEFASSEEVERVHGVKVPVGDGKHHYVCKRHKVTSATRFILKKVSISRHPVIMAVLKKIFRDDPFRSYRGMTNGMRLDNWGIEFETPPKTYAKQVSFDGTEDGRKGPWTAYLVAEEGVCVFCGVKTHDDKGRGMGDCPHAVFISSSNLAPQTATFS